MYKVRFNLGKGKNFMFWQVVNTETGSFKYYNPEKVSIIMNDAELRNQTGTAKKIFSGANKSVCAWVNCKSIEIVKRELVTNANKVSYNPRITPNWTNNEGKNIDKEKYNQLYTVSKNIFVSNLGKQLKINL